MPNPTAMRTSLLPCFRSCHFLVACAMLLSTPAFAKERFRIPPPPSPEKVFHDIRGFFHRVAGGVKNASKKTWNAIRDPFVDDEPESSSRPGPRRESAKPPPGSSFSKSKDAVPYRYDDADEFGARDPAQARSDGNETLPKVNVTPRQPAANLKPGVPEPMSPAGPSKPGQFLKPSTSDQPPVEEIRPAPPKAAPPLVDSNLEFARRVPGKRGLVYPPGAKESAENMVDVGDFQTGQIVRDPRTGKLFRVP